jgi:Domain of unknown function (DUF1707)
MSDVEGASTAHRIGDEERHAATQALNAHREAGRLDATEYEDRQVQVTRARTWAEIQPIFSDLPEPHPAGMPAGGPVSPVVRPVADASVVTPSSAAPVPAQQQGLLGAVVPDKYRSTVMALTPFAALLLFFGTHLWYWFLAIPVMGILLYGTDGDSERRTRERLQRDERRRDRERRRDS